MKEQFLYLPEDIDWLFDVHLQDFPLLSRHLWRTRTKSFVLYGNEDCPDMVDLYETASPLITDKPFMRHTFYTNDVKA